MAKSTTKKSTKGKTVKTKRTVLKGKSTKRSGASGKSINMLSVPKVLNKALVAKAAAAGIPYNRFCLDGLKKFAGL